MTRFPARGSSLLLVAGLLLGQGTALAQQAKEKDTPARLAGRGPGGPQAAGSRRRPARRRRTGQGGRSLAVGHRALPAQPGPLRRPPAPRQLPARPRAGLRPGPHALRGGRRRGEPRRGTARRRHAQDGRLLLRGAATSASASSHARRDREVPGQPAGQPGLLLHRPRPLPAGPLQPGHRGPGKVGTALAGEEGKVEKVEAGKRLFIRSKTPTWPPWNRARPSRSRSRRRSGDMETVECYPIGRNVRVVLGSIPTALGKPKPGNGRLKSAATTRSRSPTSISTRPTRQFRPTRCSRRSPSSATPWSRSWTAPTARRSGRRAGQGRQPANHRRRPRPDRRGRHPQGRRRSLPREDAGRNWKPRRTPRAPAKDGPEQARSLQADRQGGGRSSPRSRSDRDIDLAGAGDEKPSRRSPAKPRSRSRRREARSRPTTADPLRRLPGRGAAGQGRDGRSPATTSCRRCRTT